MKPKKVLIQLNQLGYGGTEKGILTFAQHLNRSQFDPYLFYLDQRGSGHYWRLKLSSSFSQKQAQRFHTKYVERFSREDHFQQVFTKKKTFHGEKSEFLTAIKEIKPDIVHLNRGDETDYYTDFVPALPAEIKVVESSIFGKIGPTQYIERLSQVYFLSSWLEKKSTWATDKSRVLYLPAIEKSQISDLRKELGIPENALVIGRASRPDLDHDQFLEQVYLQIPESLNKSVYFLCLGSKPKYSQKFLDLFGQRVLTLNATTDENRVSAFYQTLDVFTHRRPEGETFGLVIAEAMMHGIPVISHFSDVDNAQAEVLDNLEFISEFHDHTYYSKKLVQLLSNSELRKSLGQRYHHRAKSHFSAEVVTSQLENYYRELF